MRRQDSVVREKRTIFFMVTKPEQSELDVEGMRVDYVPVRTFWAWSAGTPVQLCSTLRPAAAATNYVAAVKQVSLHTSIDLLVWVMRYPLGIPERFRVRGDARCLRASKPRMGGRR